MIKVGDEVRLKEELVTERGTVISVAYEKAIVVWQESGIGLVSFDRLRLADEPTPEPAPLTGAQVAQVLEAWTDVYERSQAASPATLVKAMRDFAQAERERGHG